MFWSVLNFGKHKGKTLPQIIFIDPDYFFWAIGAQVFANKGSLAQEAREIDRKARNIKIPQKTGKEQLVVEYVIDPTTGKFGDIELVPISRPPHRGSSQTFRTDKIDLSTPSRIKAYDKLGCKLMIRSVKFHLFGNENIRMTKGKCEEFFDDDNNFA
jgi:hypothetical protein